MATDANKAGFVVLINWFIDIRYAAIHTRLNFHAKYWSLVTIYPEFVVGHYYRCQYWRLFLDIDIDFHFDIIAMDYLFF